MNNKQAKTQLTVLEIAVRGVQQAIAAEAGYAEVGECERLTRVLEALQRAIEKNTNKNIPF